jgi:hypothetical protein
MRLFGGFPAKTEQAATVKTNARENKRFLFMVAS